MEGIPIANVSHNDAMTMLEQTSRTFFIPISRLTEGLKEAVASAYLCMRAIDEIEDHESIADQTKITLLHSIRATFHSNNVMQELQQLLEPYANILPAVSVRMHEWLLLCPSSAAQTVYRYIAMMSEQMAEWVQRKWSIRTEEDLDGYTYSVAGMVGEMLSELWQWHDGTIADKVKAVAFGRGLQAVNILRNRTEDLERGVDFYPDGWEQADMIRYIDRNLQLANEYVADLKQGPALEFCALPLALAHATVQTIAGGGTKLSRANVMDIVSRVSS
ncbi:squalene/phytoene synthase family protein [Paenibacillus chartarius]|uniref:Squalene/phytoene synthase family protein n=1 Tax=Paenibacillus chartarius TaxID=747481 RepID=A0ABV6DRV3_9BACL